MRLKLTIALLITAGSLSRTQAQSVLDLSQSLTDQTVILPESFETDAHAMLQNWYLQNYTATDPSSQYIPDTPASDSEMTDRLAKLPADIEMPFNSVVRACINAYTQRRRTLVQNMLGMSYYYNPIFEEALEREKLPMELKYLPVIESALNPDAVSRAGAAGLWQFMPSTGRGMGLEINSIVDERRDPVKSSAMAARYLKQLYEIYNDWSLAIAAYNCGPGNVNKAMRRAGEGHHDFWSIYPFLPSETRGYVPAFIAANYVMNYYREHGIQPTVATRPIVTDSVHVNKRVHFQQIADILKIPVAEIRILNPQYRKDYIPGDLKPYPLVLPSYQIYSYIMSEDSIVAHEAEKYARRTVVEPSTGSQVSREDGDYIITETTQYHKVKRGETFNSIARRYGVTVNQIKRTNGIRTLRRGQTIKIVTTQRTPKPASEPVDTVINPTDDAEAVLDSLRMVDQDTIPADDTLDQMAAAAAELQSIETAEPGPAASNTGAVEQPAATPAAPITPAPAAQQQRQSQAQPVYHTVRSGESVSRIARKYHTTTQKILRLNGLTAQSKIHPGQRLRVK